MATKHRLNSSTQSDQCCTSKLNSDGTFAAVMSDLSIGADHDYCA